MSLLEVSWHRKIQWIPTITLIILPICAVWLVPWVSLSKEVFWLAYGFHIGLCGPDAGPKREVLVIVKSPTFWSRLLASADLGFAESYMLQDIDCELLSQHRGGFRRSWLHQVATGAAQLLQRSNDVEQAQINISAHYDTSNVLFSYFLSPDMNYSFAHWSAAPTEALEAAQRRKVHALLRKAKIAPAHHILDIGCGWGDLAIQAAQTYHCRVTGVTLCKEQKRWADDRIQAAGLADRIEILLCDDRNVRPPAATGYYDRVISVGMFEHVGRDYLPEYFATISRLLHPREGILVLDGITAIIGLPARTDLFMLKYIFPGGYLPTIGMLLDHIHQGSSKTLEITSAESAGSHYARSLECTDFEVEAYRRKWLYYFVVAETSFRLQLLNNFTITAARTPGSEVSYESLPYVEV
ncbi:cyclopropane-fatty-acyl-phospholipid synthase [Aspergillus indologenus CBS 114.80]|uniref:Cyclopropane-fatty-acyl-phospholipid synthase n=1 Tax=Aspergillus indologenus CBS 114.80 TaxID=1450541 RepID=A0A2V5J3B1_9EURO|nr:cyclopropane-fatty-acyl-phospholipid synthase [Aspergillus indologenus CBS 114.80]